MTSDQGNDSGNSSGNRLAPRPISRPPVDPASRQAFGRPAGQLGSFVAERVRPRKYREQAEFRPHDQPADPVLEEAFSFGNQSQAEHLFDARIDSAAQVCDGPSQADEMRARRVLGSA